MLFRRVGTQLIFNVTNPELIPLYEGNEAYEKLAEKNEPVKEEKAEEPKKTTKKK